MNDRRRLTGVVTSNKMMKTVVVRITRTYRHPLYKKVVNSSNTVKAHDELGCQEGDQVQLVESKPISREKRWVVETIVKHGQQPAVEEEVETVIKQSQPPALEVETGEQA